MMNCLVSMVITIVFVSQATAAPFAPKTTQPQGCYYNGHTYSSGERVPTDQPCLNCSCLRNSLVCFLRVCPKFPHPPPKGCFISSKSDQCCPDLKCDGGVKDTEPEEDREGPHNSSATTSDELPKLKTTHIVSPSGCMFNGSLYADGSALVSSNNCEYCFCVKSKTRCIKPRCILPLEGCIPVYTSYSCCPSRYDCSGSKNETSHPSSHELRAHSIMGIQALSKISLAAGGPDNLVSEGSIKTVSNDLLAEESRARLFSVIPPDGFSFKENEENSTNVTSNGTDKESLVSSEEDRGTESMNLTTTESGTNTTLALETHGVAAELGESENTLSNPFPLKNSTIFLNGGLKLVSGHQLRQEVPHNNNLEGESHLFLSSGKTVGFSDVSDVMDTEKLVTSTGDSEMSDDKPVSGADKLGSSDFPHSLKEPQSLADSIREEIPTSKNIDNHNGENKTISVNENVPEDMEKDTINDMIKDEIDDLKKDEMKDMTNDEMKDRTMNEMKDKTKDEMKDMIIDEMNDMKKDEIKDMTKDEMKDMTKDKMKDMTNDEMKDMTKDKMKDMTNDEMKDMTKDEMKDIIMNEMKDMTKDETKDIIMNEMKDMIKDEMQDMTKDETKDIIMNEMKDMTKDEMKDMTKDEMKDIIMNKMKDMTKDEMKDIIIDEMNDIVKDEMKDMTKEEMKDRTEDEMKDNVKDEMKDMTKDEMKDTVKDEMNDIKKHKIKDNMLNEMNWNNFAEGDTKAIENSINNPQTEVKDMEETTVHMVKNTTGQEVETMMDDMESDKVKGGDSSKLNDPKPPGANEVILTGEGQADPGNGNTDSLENKLFEKMTQEGGAENTINTNEESNEPLSEAILNIVGAHAATAPHSSVDNILKSLLIGGLDSVETEAEQNGDNLVLFTSHVSGVHDSGPAIQQPGVLSRNPVIEFTDLFKTPAEPPNLQIIPFVAADAVTDDSNLSDDVKLKIDLPLGPRQPSIGLPSVSAVSPLAEEKEMNLSDVRPLTTTHKPILFNIPDDIGGSVGKPEVLLEALEPISGDPVVKDKCFFDNRLYNNGELTTKKDPCVLCRCYFGDILCQKTECAPIPQGCKPRGQLDFCCPQLVCENSTVHSQDSLPDLKPIGTTSLPPPPRITTSPNPFQDVIKPQPAPQFSLTAPFIGNSLLNQISPLVEPVREPSTTLTPTTTPHAVVSRRPSNPINIPASSGDQKPDFFLSSLNLSGCNIYGRMYRVGRVIDELSGPCIECKCTPIGVECENLKC